MVGQIEIGLNSLSFDYKGFKRKGGFASVF